MATLRYSDQTTNQSVNRSADRLFWLCFLSYTCSYIGRKNLSASLPVIIASGLLSKTEAGYITTAYMAVYGLGQLVWGTIATRVKPQFLIATGLLGASVCNLAMALSKTALPMMFIWAANGLFHSMLWAPIIRVFTDQMPDGKREKAGLNIAPSCSVGAILAFLIPAVLLRATEWQVVFYVSSGILLTVFLVWTLGNIGLRRYITMMNARVFEQRQAYQNAPSKTDNSPRRAPSLMAVILASGVWILLFSLFCNGALRDAVETWAPTYLAERFGLDGSMAALTAVIIPLVSMTGAYIAEWIYHHFIKNEVYTCALMFAISAICIGLICLIGHKNMILCAACLAVCISAMFGANHMYLTVLPYRFAPLGLSAGITGFLNCAIFFATAAGSSLYGYLAEHYGWDILTVFWFAIAVVGVFFALVGGRVWKSKRHRLDKGQFR